MLTDEKWQELMRIAESARWLTKRKEFHETFNPDAVLQLLADLENAQTNAALWKQSSENLASQFAAAKEIAAAAKAGGEQLRARMLTHWRTIYSSSGAGQTISTRPEAFGAARELDALLKAGAK